MDRGTRLITFICGSTVWGKQERPLPEEREAQALRVMYEKQKVTQYSWFCSCGSETTSTKCFLFFFLKNMADSYTGTQGLYWNVWIWNMSRYLELHSLNTPSESLWRKTLLFISLNAPADHGGGQGFRVCFIICCHFKVLLSCSLLYIHVILIASWTKCSVFKLLRLANLQEFLGRRPLLCKISLAGMFQLTQAVQGGHNVHMYGPFLSSCMRVRFYRSL